mmetsp:Transcript_17831/g.38536  ORF Transcript_17831/g.38536 Transcript_17831/m.38536 type:complete len:305 (+) Transcript_17831:133-1047(+)|eukprot:CAMPEP_0172328066 /NCGR_PEP_ID=MMETSP1058-20130122/60158_1 /TAXON_ID=83371 /ORGANISM="Detonula confervacea, Strain CCMP 353" /LENGTH=304 /DNA_ID=CAMNT_0013045163 /DNA_START=1018 /DNA_END=1932 /DNA_ORIENTATION=-
MDLVDSLLNTPLGNEEMNTAAAPADNDNDDDNMTDEDSVQIRTMEVPRWLSTPEVTKFLVGNGKGKTLEEEYESTIVITGHGSGTKDPNAPGFHLPHLLVTMSGHDVRQLGRLRRALEDSLVDYIIENSTEQDEETANPPPSLGRLLYNLGLSAANASPKTKDHTPDRTVLARSHFPIYLHTKREANGDGNSQHLVTKKVWMNVIELPQDSETQEYHGRFLASRSFMNYYRSHFHCRVDINGVWGEDPEENLMCAPYVLITSDEKANVDKCIQYIEHRIRDHEEKFSVSRGGGRRVLKGERTES